MVAAGAGKMMSMCRAILTHDHGRHRREGASDRTAIHDHLHERHLVGEGPHRGARREEGEEALATVPIVATAKAEAGHGVAPEVEGGMGEDEITIPKGKA